MKNSNSFLDFVTNVYGKSNIVSYHEIDIEHLSKENYFNLNKQVIYLNGKLDLYGSKLDFRKNDLFTYGNYEQISEENYKFTSFKSQNSYLFVKVDSSFAYGILNAHGLVNTICRLGRDFFQNPVMDLIPEGENVNEFFENNSENNVEKLFATSETKKAYVKKLILYQINN